MRRTYAGFCRTIGHGPGYSSYGSSQPFFRPGGRNNCVANLIRPERLQVSDLFVSPHLTTVRPCAIIMPQGGKPCTGIRAQYGLSWYHIFFSLSSPFRKRCMQISPNYSVSSQRKRLTNVLPCIIIIRHLRECWNGRQARLRCVWLRRVGSSPISRTKKEDADLASSFLVQ